MGIKQALETGRGAGVGVTKDALKPVPILGVVKSEVVEVVVLVVTVVVVGIENP